MADGVLKVLMVSPEKAVFEGDAAALVVPMWDGMVGILPRHAPMLALLGTGELTLDLPGGGSRSFYVSDGVLKVENDQVTVLTEHASTEMPTGARVSPGEVLSDGDTLASAANPLD